MKLYLWDQTAKDFYKKFTSSEDTPTVLLVTTVNPKVIAGNQLIPIITEPLIIQTLMFCHAVCLRSLLFAYQVIKHVCDPI